MLHEQSLPQLNDVAKTLIQSYSCNDTMTDIGKFKSNEVNLDHEGKHNESVYNDLIFIHL
ncbi:hypothetical protein [Agriterribacter sp.]|uniref:hypothetical protein n=1 Tax=Agriterribacter sp. TaxID=2821509 RepID=UPI002B76AF72|nr:hypothetical protein [Agriterribacter sp.]HRP58089.1 hypothetical protein [Agriterribacter sp.]